MAMPTPSSTVVYSTVVNDFDQGALVTITAIICAVSAGMLFAVRLLIRWPWNKTLGKDDVAVTIATLLALIQVAVTASAVTSGLGKRNSLLSPADISRVEKMVYASNLLYIANIVFSQIAIIVLLVRLSSARDQIRISRMIGLVAVLVGVASLFIIAIAQPYSKPWTLLPLYAQSQFDRWVATEILSLVMDIAIMVFPLYLVYGLKMSKDSKYKVILGFQSRVLVLAFIIPRLIDLSSLQHESDQIFHYARVEIWTLCRMCYTLVCATLPCLNIYFRDAETGILGGHVIIANAQTWSSTPTNHFESMKSGSARDHTPVELTSLSRGRTVANAQAATGEGRSGNGHMVDMGRAITVRSEINIE